MQEEEEALMDNGAGGGGPGSMRGAEGAVGDTVGFMQRCRRMWAGCGQRRGERS